MTGESMLSALPTFGKQLCPWANTSWVNQSCVNMLQSHSLN